VTVIRVANVIEEGRLAGPQRRIVSVAARLRAVGVETTVIFPSNNSAAFASSLASAGIDSTPVGIVKPRLSPAGFMIYSLCFVRDILRLARILRVGNFDVIHCSGGAWQIRGVLAGRLAGGRVIWHLNDTGPMPFAVRLLFRLVSRLPNAFVVAGERVSDYYGGLIRPRGHDRPIVEIQAPVDCAMFDPRVVMPPPRDRGTSHVVSVGNINPWKGFEDFIEMAALLQSRHPQRFRFSVYGPTYDSQRRYAVRLRKLASQRGVASFEFRPAQSDIRAALAGADVYVCTSVTEASPMAVWEAMAMAKAVVSTDVGDVRRFVGAAQAGIVVPVGDPAQLASAVETIVFDPSFRRGVERKARAVALSDFDLSRCVERHEQLYRGLVNQPAFAARP
jgi:glycosyltransferase involved in cell wall biosynthesis